MTRAQAIGGVGIVAALIGGVVVLSQLGPSGQAGIDGGFVATYQLPDGGAWDIAPDASVLVTCVVGPTALSSFCYLANGTGYQEVGATALLDGGFTLGLPQAFSCVCASGASACNFSDGGPVPLTGTYPAAGISGLGCVPRPCVERSGWTGAPQGCLP